MSLTDPTRDDSWTLSGIMRRTSLRPYRFRQLLNTKSSSLMRQITRPQMYNSPYGHLLRNLLVIADSSSPATTKTKSSVPSTPDVQSSTSHSKERNVNNSAGQFFQRLQEILGTEGIKYDNKVLVELIQKHFPDWRRVLNECQRYSSGGEIDSGILASFATVKTDDLFKRLKEKDFPSVRKWVVNNLDNDPSVLLRSIYDAYITILKVLVLVSCPYYR